MCTNMSFKVRAFAVSFIASWKCTTMGPLWFLCTIFSWPVSIHRHVDGSVCNSNFGHTVPPVTPFYFDLFLILLIIAVDCLDCGCHGNLQWAAVGQRRRAAISHYLVMFTVTDRRLCFWHGDKALGCQASINVHSATGTNTHIRRRRRYRRRRLCSAWRRRTNDAIEFQLFFVTRLGNQAAAPCCWPPRDTPFHWTITPLNSVRNRLLHVLHTLRSRIVDVGQVTVKTVSDATN